MDPELEDVAAHDDAEVGELLNLTTADGSHILGTEQTRDFLNLVLDSTPGGLLGRIPPANRIPMDATSRDIARMSLPAVGIQWGLAGYERMDPANYMVPTYDHRDLVLYNWDGHMDIETDTLDDNLQGPAHEGALSGAVATTIGNNLEESAWKSDTAGGAVPEGECWTTDWDGWRVLLADGNVVDFEGGGVGPALFQTMIEELPKALQPTSGNPLNFRFLMCNRVFFAWRTYLQNRVTPLGDMQLIDGNVPAYGSIPLTPQVYIPDDVAGVDSLSESADTFSYVALVRDQEFFMGFKPMMKVHRALRTEDGKVLHLHWRGRVGFQIAVPEWTVTAVNVEPAAAA